MSGRDQPGCSAAGTLVNASGVQRLYSAPERSRADTRYLGYGGHECSWSLVRSTVMGYGILRAC